MRASTLPVLALVVAIGACANGDAAVVRLDEPTLLGGSTPAGAAPAFAVSARGVRASAWVAAPGGGTDARLHVRTDSGESVVGDPLGPVEAHGESPPKLAWAGDGALYALYVVPRVVPGRRFPQAALRLVRSADAGRTWGAPATVTDDSVFGSHNFHALHTATDGTVYVAWLDGRDGKSAAYVTRSADGGRTWSPNVRAASDTACPCCRTALATAADGTLYLAWRSVLPGNIRDVVVARSTDRGATWSAPVRVHRDDWKFDGCPHAGPALQVDSAGAVHVAWWTGREGAAGVYYARSTDGARTFGDAIPLGVAEFSKPAHVQLALGRGGRVLAAWDDGTLRTPRVVLRASTDGGRSFAPAQLVSGEGPAATFPVLAVSDSSVTVAWSEASAEAHAHEEAMVANAHAHAAAMAQLTPVGDSRVLARAGRLP